ncbi:MAG: YdcF family protein [Roseibium sp.]|uniref:YdcF family protein n=1 Tax=Roseibium sp. TaxID=1936156 RepID=UPI001B27EAAC|nr:YdcF family protein [Roseibium sp.]MBO6894076.1 YdcF family protein [Roseibium sp.]MBO6929720.1 YdcF family protein [Roseibium sp.]
MTNADTAVDPALEDSVPIVSERQASAQPKEQGSQAVRKKRVGLRILIVSMIAALIAGASGHFLFFAHKVASSEVPVTTNADAIVVLTGGQARVSEAVRLLEEGNADRLLISGVHPGTTREQLAAVTSSNMPLERGSVELDRHALNTAGNASETAAWVRKNGFKSLLVVTSAYHLPRARAELSGALPDVDLIAYPVFSKDLNFSDWYKEPTTFRLLMREYVKYIVARLRIAVRSVS